MRKSVLVIAVFLSTIALTACSSTPTAPGKGKQITDCLDKHSPDECDRKVNRSRY